MELRLVFEAHNTILADIKSPFDGAMTPFGLTFSVIQSLPKTKVVSINSENSASKNSRRIRFKFWWWEDGRLDRRGLARH